MNRRSLALAATFAGLVLLGARLAVVAADERRPGLLSTEFIGAASVFGGMTPCDVPGLREHLLGTGAHTKAYAGEFTPTSFTPWTQVNSRMYLYIVSGTGVIRINSLTEPAKAGDFFLIPKGARHAVNATSAILRAVYVEERG